MSKNILVINSGSSSIKFQLFDITSKEVIIKGIAEEIGSPIARITIKYDGQSTTEKIPGADFETAMRRIFDELDERGLKSTIKAVGHRVVNGGEKIKDSVIIDDQVMAAIEAATVYAPLHNPAQIAGIRAITKIMPNLPQVAVFDTAFHQTMPPRAYRYTVPTEWYEKYGVRRYGAHGTSYRFVARAAAKMLGIPLKKSAFIIAHLGNGISVAAVLNGQSVDTSMGFTPLEGVVMGTRSGSVDPAIVPFMMKKLDKSADEILSILNKESGLLGLSGLSSDQRELETAAAEGDENAALALDILTYSIAKHIAAMMVALPRVDALILTGGAGERGIEFRENIIKHLAVFDYKLDPELNKKMREEEGIISPDGAPTVVVIRTNEELMIAEDTARLNALSELRR
ncbi:acetate kinase [Candidatus Saccharibacteria bacterium]|nr:acetate kinase [Candidatus Saccharibacteria bacterium]